jgi:hypothetical protein
MNDRALVASFQLPMVSCQAGKDGRFRVITEAKDETPSGRNVYIALTTELARTGNWQLATEN